MGGQPVSIGQTFRNAGGTNGDGVRLVDDHEAVGKLPCGVSGGAGEVAALYRLAVPGVNRDIGRFRCRAGHLINHDGGCFGIKSHQRQAAVDGLIDGANVYITAQCIFHRDTAQARALEITIAAHGDSGITDGGHSFVAIVVNGRVVDVHPVPVRLNIRRYFSQGHACSTQIIVGNFQGNGADAVRVKTAADVGMNAFNGNNNAIGTHWHGGKPKAVFCGGHQNEGWVDQVGRPFHIEYAVGL